MSTGHHHTTPWLHVCIAGSIYFAFSLVGILNHELWLDEAQHFLIARDSDSISSLAGNMRYDGHVPLWNYLLYFITHYISDSPLAMQLLHLVIINAAVLIFLRHAPFSWGLKLAIVFGYYFLFEYSLISRNYALGLVFLFMVCHLASYREKYLHWIALLCLLLCTTHLFFVFAAAGFYFYFLFYYLGKKTFTFPFWLLTFSLILGIFLASYQLSQVPGDNTYFHPGSVELGYRSLTHPLYSIGRGFLPLPVFGTEFFWNTWLFDQLIFPLKWMISLGLLGGTVYFFRQDKKTLVFYVTCILLLMAFLFSAQMLGKRYTGMFPVFFICAAWLYRNERSLHFALQPVFLQHVFRLSLYVILFVQLASGVYAYAQDLRKPFTLAKDTVRYLEDHQLVQQSIVIDGYGSGPAISAYLGKKVFYLDTDSAGSYLVWRQANFPKERKSLPEMLDKSAMVRSMEVFILVSSRNAGRPGKRFQYDELAKFSGGLMKPDYYLYRVTRSNEAHDSIHSDIQARR
jgi:hypothetical protein